MNRRQLLKFGALVSSFSLGSRWLKAATRELTQQKVLPSDHIPTVAPWASELQSEWANLPETWPQSFQRLYSEEEIASSSEQMREILKANRKGLAKVRKSSNDDFRELKDGNSQMLAQLLSVSTDDLESLQEGAVSGALGDFMEKARAFDGRLSSREVFQGGRNVITGHFLQMVDNQDVHFRWSLAAYSLLYPYTDNFLDNEDLTDIDKLSFAERFRNRLRGQDVAPASEIEEKMFDLVSLIEKDIPRRQYPEVYGSLLLIHNAQVDSLVRQKQKNPNAWSNDDLLAMSISKGGASVLADAYLIQPDINPDLARLSYRIGFCLQMVDDLQDMEEDLQNGDVTIFTKEYQARGNVDGAVIKLLHLVDSISKETAKYAAKGGTVNSAISTAFLNGTSTLISEAVDAEQPRSKYQKNKGEYEMVDSQRIVTASLMSELQSRVPYKLDALNGQTVESAFVRKINDDNDYGKMVRFLNRMSLV